MATITTTVDDTNTNIQYTGPWVLGGTENEYDGTTHGTSTVGAQAVYKFNGKSTPFAMLQHSSLIEVFGTIGMENNGDPSFAATSSYKIDGGSTVDFTGAIENVTLYKQLFFTSQALGEGQHTLVISYVTAGKNPLWLDYFQVIRSTANSTSSISSSSTLTTSSSLSTTSESSTLSSSNVPTATSSTLIPLIPYTQSSSDVATSTTSISTSSPQTQPAPKSSGLSAGTIGGIIVGSCWAVLLLAIIIYFIWRLARQRSRKHGSSDYSSVSGPSSGPSQILELHPFDPHATPSTQRYYYPVPASEKSGASYGNHYT